VLFVVEAGRWQAADASALARLDKNRAPVALVVNKADQVADKARLLPFIAQVSGKRNFAFVVPVSAARSDNLEALISECAVRMPKGPFLFPKDEYTDRNLRFIAAETVREKLTLFLQQELPYSAAVEIEDFNTDADGVTRIQACIWVARANHKAIVIGRGGQMLKKIGRAARLELIERIGGRVDLRLWVKLRENWNDDETAVRDLGH
jgi:GTP-binding protein Era